MEIYIGVLFAVILLSPVLHGTYKHNKTYIIIVALILFAVCALRGIRVGADLGRYETHYNTCTQLSFSGILQNYKENFGFYFLMRAHSLISGCDYHGFLFILAVFEGIVLSYIIYKHSVNPYMSILLYMALGYYVFTFSGLKQALATAFVMLAFDSIVERRKLRFIIFMALAGLMHFPALIFLPSYFIAHRKMDRRMILAYALAAIVIFMFKGQIVIYVSDIYDSVVSSSVIGGVGGKVAMMLLFVVCGYLLRFPDGENETYSTTFHFMIIAMLLQMFAAFGNVFERLADYYFIFAILFLPMAFEHSASREGSVDGAIIYNNQLYGIANMCIFLFLALYYYMTVSSIYGLIPYSFYWE